MKFLWTNECCRPFEELKRKLTTAPVPAYPEFDLAFVLDTDGSDTGIGAVLSQVHDGKERVIQLAYAS